MFLLSPARPKIKYAGMVIIVLFIALACNAPAGLGGAMTPGIKGTPPPFLEITVTPRDTNRIVIMRVDTDNNMNISQVSLLLPSQLDGSEIYANDTRIDVSATGGEEVELNLAGKANAREVTITFKSGSQQLASCTIKVADPLTPAGDCGW